MAKAPEVQHLEKAIKDIGAALKHDSLPLKEQQIEEDSELESRPTVA